MTAEWLGFRGMHKSPTVTTAAPHYLGSVEVSNSVNPEPPKLIASTPPIFPLRPKPLTLNPVRRSLSGVLVLES